MGDKTVTAKSVAMCVLFTASLILGTLPLLLSRIFRWNPAAQNNPYVKKLLCFGGGVLLCTTFIHLLPEVTEKMRKLQGISKPSQLAELLMCAGFFTIYLVEECVHACLHRHKDETFLARTLSVRRIDSEEDKSSTASPRNSITICVEDRKHVDHSHSDHDDDHDHKHGRGHSHFVPTPEDSTVKTIRGLFIVLALSVHELFEGLAVGLESSSKNVWYMFGAVSAHKLVIAFCIGIELVTSGMKTFLVIIYVFVFAVVSPLGIGIGIVVTAEEESATDLSSVLLQGLASGTLLYVVFFEILSSDRKSGLLQFLTVAIGFLVMLSIKIVGS